MDKLGKEFLVGLLVIAVILLIGVFAWLMGTFEPFRNVARFHVLYNFAGGIEKGSPVRLAGVKVGKVDKIAFLTQEEGQDGVALKLTITVSRAASYSVREDSKFYVNMAGIIGERYIEISPGTTASAILIDGSTMRGVDPPRIDQLLSQGYGVFGKITELLENNEKEVAEFMTHLSKTLKEVNEVMKKSDWKKISTLIDNVNGVTSDLRVLTKKFSKPSTQDLLDKISEMIDRSYQIDKEALKQFFQEDGIRARIF